MAKLFLAALCDDVREEKTGKFSLMGIFDQFVIGDFRAALPPFWLFTQIGFDAEGNHSLTVELRRVEGEVIMKVEAPHQVAGKNRVTGLHHANVNLRLQNLTIPGPGAYEFAIYSDGQHLGSLPVEVAQAPPRLIQ